MYIINYLKDQNLNWKFTTFPGLWQFKTVESSFSGLVFNHPRPVDFIRSQWNCFAPKYFTVYRVLLAIILFAWMIWDITRETVKYFHHIGYTWFTYATNWTFMVFVFIHIILAICCLIYNIKYFPSEPRFYQPIWFLYNLASTSVLVICVVFWFALSNSSMDVFTSWQGRVKHSLTGIIVLIDLCLCAIPVRMLHVIYPFTAGLLYCFFTYLFWLFRGKGAYGIGQIYPGIEWDKPKSTSLACLSGLMTSILCHVVLYIVYFARVKISAKIGGRGYILVKEANEQQGYDNMEFNLNDEIGQQEKQTSIKPSNLQNPLTISQKYGTVE
ncbi:unnamed protein product [Heterobilharzia americana]|nr:unnamed protein product [Heterobilharzia americana]CAH8463767.1 unnamed protein product [Heterobilharzia americana]